MEYKGFRLSRTKKEYMECQFSKSRIKDKRAVKFDGQEIKSESFWYLGSIIDKDGEIKENVKSQYKSKDEVEKHIESIV